MQTALTYRTNRDLFSNYYLDEHLPETEAWDEIDEDELQSAYEEIEALWEREKATAPKRNESQLEEKFIRPMFRKLGIPFEVEESTSRTQRRPDYGFFESERAATEAFGRREAGDDFYQNAVAVADAKRWGRPLDTRGSGEHERDFENPSYQIHVYLQETPVRWAVLTNGQKWRLYYAPTSHHLDSYYEVDFPTIIESGDLEAFKYFYLFFRHEAFLEDASGDCFLDDVYDESNVFARELGEDLQDNIYEAIKVLSEGFLQYPDNDLGEDDLALIHDSSLIYLYRLIFVLYAEAEGRELLDTNNEIYEQSYSLNLLKQEIAEELDSANSSYRDWQDTLGSRLDELFQLIDQGSKLRGIPEDDLYIPAYNGGLFRTNPDEDDSSEARFLADHKVSDAHLAKVIELLTRSRNGNGGGKIFADYSSLDVRHLGSIYEGLLEYQLNIAEEPLALDDGEYVSADDGDEIVVEPGEVYLTTDSGERKATGSYYTPEYIVEYIIENTLGPLVEEIREDLLEKGGFGEGGFAEQFAERVFDLKILDPAMGSGHFLTNAVDYLAREIIDAQEKQAAQQGIETVSEDHDINWARRQVAQRCIYGVDLNPLAVELAKVSLWLRTLAAEQPLAFLDHHLKTGNSLVGSDIEEIEALESDRGGDGENSTLADFGIARKGTIEQLMRIYQDFIAIENQELADVKEMEAKYDEFERNKLRQRLEAIANVHTAEDFGLDNLPSDAYERMAVALEDDEKWDTIEKMSWYRNAQVWADDLNYLHWKLAFPEVFYEVDGNSRNDAGFDGVIGNPPWIRSINLKKADKASWRYYKEQYDSARKGEYDIYLCFIEKGFDLLNRDGEFGYVVPNKWLTSQVGAELRELMADSGNPRKLVDFGSRQIFDGITTYSCLLFLNKRMKTSFTVHELDDSTDYPGSDLLTSEEVWKSGDITIEDLSSDPWSFTLGPIGSLFDRLENYPLLEEYGNVFMGVGTRADDVFLLRETDEGLYSEETESHIEVEEELLRPSLKGSDIDEYYFERHRKLLFPYYESDSDDVSLIPPRELKTKYPNAWKYLNEAKDALVSREGGKFEEDDEWYKYSYPRNIHRLGKTKVLIPDVVNEATTAFDREGWYILDTAYGVESDIVDERYLTAILNCDLLTAFLERTGTDLRGGYFRMKTAYLNPFPVPEINPDEIYNHSELVTRYKKLVDAQLSGETEEIPAAQIINEDTPSAAAIHDLICLLVDLRTDYTDLLHQLNLNLIDYLGSYEKGPTLSDIEGYQPTAGASRTTAAQTSKDKENLRIGGVEVAMSRNKLVVKVSSRYKPENNSKYETDRWGYTETTKEPVMEFVGLDEMLRKLIREFIPVAVSEADGFAGFRGTATKTKSIVNRLEELTLPKVSSIESEFEQYLSNKQKSDELTWKITRLDENINQFLYYLYDLSDEDIEVLNTFLSND